MNLMTTWCKWFLKPSPTQSKQNKISEQRTGGYCIPGMLYLEASYARAALVSLSSVQARLTPFTLSTTRNCSIGHQTHLRHGKWVDNIFLRAAGLIKIVENILTGLPSSPGIPGWPISPGPPF